MGRATLFDGVTADQHDALISAEGDALIVEAGGERDAIPAGDHAVVEEDSRSLVLSRKGRPRWRQIVDKPV